MDSHFSQIFFFFYFLYSYQNTFNDILTQMQNIDIETSNIYTKYVKYNILVPHVIIKYFYNLK